MNLLIAKSWEHYRWLDVWTFLLYPSFQGLFRNFGDSILPVFKPHLERLADDQQESSQRCLTEIVAGLMRGSKHWGFKKVKNIFFFHYKDGEGQFYFKFNYQDV